MLEILKCDFSFSSERQNESGEIVERKLFSPEIGSVAFLGGTSLKKFLVLTNDIDPQSVSLFPAKRKARINSFQVNAAAYFPFPFKV